MEAEEREWASGTLRVWRAGAGGAMLLLANISLCSRDFSARLLDWRSVRFAALGLSKIETVAPCCRCLMPLVWLCSPRTRLVHMEERKGLRVPLQVCPPPSSPPPLPSFHAPMVRTFPFRCSCCLCCCCVWLPSPTAAACCSTCCCWFGCWAQMAAGRPKRAYELSREMRVARVEGAASLPVRHQVVPRHLKRPRVSAVDMRRGCRALLATAADIDDRALQRPCCRAECQKQLAGKAQLLVEMRP